MVLALMVLMVAGVSRTASPSRLAVGAPLSSGSAAAVPLTTTRATSWPAPSGVAVVSGAEGAAAPSAACACTTTGSVATDVHNNRASHAWFEFIECSLEVKLPMGMRCLHGESNGLASQVALTTLSGKISPYFRIVTTPMTAGVLCHIR